MFEKLFERSGLSLERQRSFLAFVQAGSISRAAPGDLNAQSLMSRQIKELEQFFGSELTVRRGKSLVPTAVGLRLADLIRQHFQDLEDLLLEQAGKAKVFTLGSGSSVLDWLILPAAAELRRVLGGAMMRLESFRSGAVVEAVREGRVDLAVVRKDALPAGGKFVVLGKISFHLCVPRRLLKAKMADDTELDDPKLWQSLPFAAGRDGGQTDVAIRAAMAKAGVKFEPQLECSSMLQVLGFVQRGECAAILPSLGLRQLSSKTVAVREWAPLKSYGRQLVLHYNPRVLSRRGVEPGVVKELARVLLEAQRS
jgi:DNA-binding transcriptional LysR family regulator